MSATGDRVQLKVAQSEQEKLLTILYESKQETSDGAKKDFLYVISSEAEKLSLPFQTCKLAGQALTDEDGNALLVLFDKQGEHYFVVDPDTQTLQRARSFIKPLMPGAKVIEGQAPSDARYLQKVDFKSLQDSSATELAKNIFIHAGKPLLHIKMLGKNPAYVCRSLEDFAKDIRRHVGNELDKLSANTSSSLRNSQDKALSINQKLNLADRLEQANSLYKALLKAEKNLVLDCVGQSKAIEGFSHLSGGEAIGLIRKIGEDHVKLPVEYDAVKKTLFVRLGQQEIIIPHTAFEVCDQPVKDGKNHSVVVVQDKNSKNYYFSIDENHGLLQPTQALLKYLPLGDAWLIKSTKDAQLDNYKNNLDLPALMQEKPSQLLERVFVHEFKLLIKLPCKQGEPKFIYCQIDDFLTAMHALNSNDSEHFLKQKITDKGLNIDENETQKRVAFLKNLTLIHDEYEILADDSYRVLHDTDAYEDLSNYRLKSLSKLKTLVDFEGLHQKINADFLHLEKNLKQQWHAQEHNGVISETTVAATVLEKKQTLLKLALKTLAVNRLQLEQDDENRDDVYDRDKTVLDHALVRRQALYKELSIGVNALVSSRTMTPLEGQTFLEEQISKTLFLSMGALLTSNMFLFDREDGLLRATDDSPWIGNLDDLVWTMAAGQAENSFNAFRSRQAGGDNKSSPAGLNFWQTIKAAVVDHFEQIVDRSFREMPALARTAEDQAFEKKAKVFFNTLVNSCFSEFEISSAIDGPVAANFSVEKIKNSVIKKAESLKTEQYQSQNPLCFTENIAAAKAVINRSKAIDKATSLEVLRQKPFFKVEISLNSERGFFTRLVDWFAGRTAEQSTLLKLLYSLPAENFSAQQRADLVNHIKKTQVKSLRVEGGKIIGLGYENNLSSQAKTLAASSAEVFYRALNKSVQSQKISPSDVLRLKLAASASQYAEQVQKIQAYEESRFNAIKSLVNKLGANGTEGFPLPPINAKALITAQDLALIGPLLGPSVRPSVGPSVGPSVRSSAMTKPDIFQAEKSLLLDVLRQRFYHAREQPVPDALTQLFFARITAKTTAATHRLVSKPWLNSEKIGTFGLG